MSSQRQRSAAKKGEAGGKNTPSRARSDSKKRNPSSPLDEYEPKKLLLSQLTPKQNGQNSETITTDITPDKSPIASPAQLSHITFRREDLDYIAECLKNSFKDDMKIFIKESVSEAVEETLRSVHDRMDSLETQNHILEQENEDLKVRIVKLEAQCDQNEQYGRRNCLRISGVPETEDSTDDYIMKVCTTLNVPITIQDIDRSHRVGKKEAPGGKPRAILAKFSTYRARQLFYRSRFSLQSTEGYSTVFVNEDLTKRRNSLLYHARGLVKSGNILKAWSSDGQILVKDDKEKIIQIHSEVNLKAFV